MTTSVSDNTESNFTLGRELFLSGHFTAMDGILYNSSCGYTMDTGKLDPRETSICIDHPSTKGCLLEMARRRYHDPYVRVRYSRTQSVWEVYSEKRLAQPIRLGVGTTEGEALARALLAP